MNNGYGVTPFAIAGILTSIFGIVILREQLSRSSSPLSGSIGEDVTRGKPYTQKKRLLSEMKKCVTGAQEGIQTADEVPTPTRAEGVPYTARKKKQVTFVGDLLGPGEKIMRNIQRDVWWLGKSIQGVDAQLRVQTLDDEEGDRTMMDDGGDKVTGYESPMRPATTERVSRREHPSEGLNESTWFKEAVAKGKELAFFHRPLGICTCGNILPVRLEEDGDAIRKITQTVEVTTEGVKSELRSVSQTQEISNNRLAADLESVQLEIDRQSSLILILQKSLVHASAEPEIENRDTAELERQLAESKRRMAMHEDKLEMMEALYSELERRGGYDAGISLRGMKEGEMLAWEKEELVEKMRELERAHQDLYARDAVVWELRQRLDRGGSNQTLRGTLRGAAIIERPSETSGSRAEQSSVEWERLRMENVRLQEDVVALKHNRREVIEQDVLVATLKSEVEEWKNRFEAAQEMLASRATGLSESREDTRRTTKEVQALRLSLESTKNQTVVGLEDSVIQLEGVISDLKKQLIEKQAAYANSEDRMADLRKREVELRAQSSAEKNQASIREAELQRSLNAATSELAEMKELQEELKKLRALHDGLKGGLEITTTHLESTQRALKQKDMEVAELHALLLDYKASSREEEVQRLKNQLIELHATHEATVSALGNDMEAMSSRLWKELEDLASRNSQLDQWLSIQKEQVKIREQDWTDLQRIHKEETNRLTLEIQDISQQLVDVTQGLRSELNEMRESRDGTQERLEAMIARFEDAQLALEEKSEEIASLRSSLMDAQAGLQTKEEIIDKLKREANLYKEDDMESLDESMGERMRPGSTYSTTGERREKQGRPLSGVLEDSGFLGKALSYGYRSSLKKKKIPAFAQEAVMKLGSGTRTSSRESMRSV